MPEAPGPGPTEATASDPRPSGPRESAGLPATTDATEQAGRTPYDVFDPNCPTRAVLDLIGSRWTVLVIGALCKGPLRFGQLRRRVGGISTKVLTQVLRTLVRDGLVTRTVYPELPPRTEYQLTALGQDLEGPLAALRGWAETHIEGILAARAAAESEAPTEWPDDLHGRAQADSAVDTAAGSLVDVREETPDVHPFTHWVTGGDQRVSPARNSPTISG